jgi:hypothetical protein
MYCLSGTHLPIYPFTHLPIYPFTHLPIYPVPIYPVPIYPVPVFSTMPFPRADGAKRRARVLIPPGYLHPGKRKH